MCCVRPFGQKIFFSIVQMYEYDVKVSRTRTFVRGQRRTNVRPCGRTLNHELKVHLLTIFTIKLSSSNSQNRVSFKINGICLVYVDQKIGTYIF